MARTVDSGLTWTLIDASEMLGYRSCVAYVPGLATPTWVAVGDTGSDLSLDDGRTWQPIGEVGFHTISFANSSDSGWAAGADGRVARFVAVLSDEYE